MPSADRDWWLKEGHQGGGLALPLQSWKRGKANVQSEGSAGNFCLLHAGELEALQGAMGTGDQTEVLGRLVSRVATLEAAAGEAEAQRRALHNQLVELRGNVSD